MSVSCPHCGAVAGYGHEIGHRIGCPLLSMPKVKPGWRDEGLEEAVEIITAVPELNAVLERESAILAQNVVSAMLGAQSEEQAARLANDETKKALARSMLIGLTSRHHLPQG